MAIVKPDVRTVFNLLKRKKTFPASFIELTQGYFASLKCAERYALSGDVYHCMPLTRLKKALLKSTP